eukprot:scaffold28993_cov34-Phaeocystis_antarctica.AAC.2
MSKRRGRRRPVPMHHQRVLDVQSSSSTAGKAEYGGSAHCRKHIKVQRVKPKNLILSYRLVSHMRPRNEVVDLDSRSVLPSGPWGLVVGFRRRGFVRSKDRPSISLQQKSATETDKMPQLRFWARSPTNAVSGP